MTIGQKIIFSSTLVALLAALAPFMGMKSTQSVRDKLVNTLTETTKEFRVLDDIKSQMNIIQSDIYTVIKELNLKKIKNLQEHNDNGQLLIQRIKVLKTRIENVEIHPFEKSQYEIEKLPGFCESLIVQVQQLHPSNNIITRNETFKTATNSKLIVDDFMKSIDKVNKQEYQLIEEQGKVVAAEINNLNFWIMLIGGLTCLLAIVFGQIIARNLSTEISKLHEAAASLNKGDYSVRVNSKSNDEFGKLGKTFDGMASYLQQTKLIEEQKVELERLNNTLKIKNNSLDSFVYRVSHDLKAPVINIRSFVKMIQSTVRSNKGNDNLEQPFFFLNKSVDKLEHTILDLLEVSKIEKDLDTKKEWIDLATKLKKVTAENSSDIIKDDILITSKFNIPKLYFSKVNLESILSNLISNSIKYRSTNRQATIHIETFEKDDFVCLQISDNGIGIDLEKHSEKLFGMFNRFHNHVDGSGVGLYIVKKIVEKDGGRIEVDSEVGKGTIFSLYLNQEKVPALLEL